MLSFKSFNESALIDSGLVQLIYDKTGDVSLKLGKGQFKPYVKKVDGTNLSAFSIYSVTGSDSTSVLKLIKNKSMTDEQYSSLLSRSAIYANKLIRELKTDIIVTPLSSSTLTRDFAKEIVKRAPHIQLLTDSFVKSADPSTIKIDDAAAPGKLSDGIRKALESSIRRAVRLGYFQMKWVPPSFRKFLKNIFSYEGNAEIFEGKNVLILDDVITSGSSIAQIYKTIMEASAENVHALVMFKSTK